MAKKAKLSVAVRTPCQPKLCRIRTVQFQPARVVFSLYSRIFRKFRVQFISAAGAIGRLCHWQSADNCGGNVTAWPGLRNDFTPMLDRYPSDLQVHLPSPERSDNTLIPYPLFPVTNRLAC